MVGFRCGFEDRLRCTTIAVAVVVVAMVSRVGWLVGRPAGRSVRRCDGSSFAIVVARGERGRLVCHVCLLNMSMVIGYVIIVSSTT